MNLEKAMDLFYRTLDLIKDPGIKKFSLNAAKKIPKEFFIAKSSSSGHYHTPENNIKGGLLVHVLKVELYGIDSCENLCPEYKDHVLSSAAFHDSWKGMKQVNENWEWDGYAPDHALLAYKWLEQFDLNEKDKKIIRSSIRTHMADLSYPDSEKNLALFERLPLPQRILQFSDQAASRRWDSFIPGIDVIELIKVNGLKKKNENNNEYENRIYEIVDSLVLKGLEKAIDKLYKRKAA